jgi:hypothetical protein
VDDTGVRRDGPGRVPRRWPWVLAATVVVVLLLSGASFNDGGTARLGAASLRPVYEGQYVTPLDVATLQEQGLAEAHVVNRELVCQGIELYFNTAAERDAYVAGYDARFPVEPPYLAGDPCRPFRNSPRYVVGS